MVWTLAPSLTAMRYELDRLWPKRSTASDGTIGDKDHSARESDHNPDERGIVHARDVTHDPANGVDCGALVGIVVAHRDPRIKLIIWDSRIWRSYNRPATTTRPYLAAWHPEKYTGPDPHTKHAHFSVLSTPTGENDTSYWWQQADYPATPTTFTYLELLMPVFKNDGDAEVLFVRKAYLELLHREPESPDVVLFWIEDLRRHGADYVWSRIADSAEGAAARAAHRKLLGLA